VRLRHAQWCRAFAEPNWRAAFGAEQPEMLTRTAREIDNLRAALSWTFQQHLPHIGGCIASYLGAYWLFSGPWREGRGWIQRALADATALDALPAGLLYIFDALIGEAAGDVTNAAAMAERGYELLSASPDAHVRARAQIARGSVAFSTGNYALAEEALAAALAGFQHLGLDALAGTALNGLARLADLRGDRPRATALFDEALSLQHRAGSAWGKVWPLKNLARIALADGQLPQAAALYAESLALCVAHADRTGSLGCLRGLADVALAAERYATAARWLGLTHALGEAVGSLPTGAAQQRFERVIAHARAHLSAPEFDAAWSAGRMSPITHTVAEAEQLAADLVVPAPADHTRVELLSAREVDVLRLVAQGLSTAEIAAQLYLSPRTITTHLASIYNKLGFNSRSAATRFAIEHGLT
jgi:non-specific serine/threonine protein kinase